MHSGNTHCEGFPLARNVNSPAECLAACCAAGDACETYQWCEPGQVCAKGYWSQSGTYGRGSDLDGWPQNTTVAVAEAACTASRACVGYTYSSTDLHPGATKLKIYLKNSSTGPMPDSTWSRHMKAGAGCATGKLGSSCSNSSTGWSSRAMRPRPAGPCDIFAAAGTPCVAAHSVVRTLYRNYSGPLYRVLRDSDHASLNIGAHHNGFAKTVDQDTFCEGTACYILRLFDQSPHRNHLDTSPAGGACHIPLSPVNASRDPITISGKAVRMPCIQISSCEGDETSSARQDVLHGLYCMACTVWSVLYGLHCMVCRSTVHAKPALLRRPPLVVAREYGRVLIVC